MKIKWMMKRIGAWLYNNRSNIEFVAGTTMVIVGTGIIMSKAEEAEEVKGEMEFQINRIRLRDELQDEDGQWNTSHERTKACLKMTKNTAIGYAKVYGVGIGIETAGLVLIGISHATDRSELASTSAALASLATQFFNYRENVRKEYGIEKDEELLTNAEEIVSVNENGEETITVTPKTLPDHSFLFDEINPNYEKEPFMNYDFLKAHERWLNEKLWVEGMLWENDIRRDINAPISSGASQGDWGITAVDEKGNRNYISFGLDADTERARAFREGREASFLIILNNMEPNISKKLYRLDKYHQSAIKVSL